MAKLVIDANIFIDIEVADLTCEIFRLSDIIVTPDVLFKEELSDRHPELPILGLAVARLSSSEVAEVERLRALYQKPSTNDLFALPLAKARGWTLLSGDANLREAAKIENVDVHGTLWLMEYMVDSEIITPRQASVGLKQMRKHGRRLPWTKVEALRARLLN